MNYKDLREWIEEADKLGELRTIEGADPEHEIGAITELNAKNTGPAILFDKVKGYSPGFRVLTDYVANIRTLNLTFGLPNLDLRINQSGWANHLIYHHSFTFFYFKG